MPPLYHIILHTTIMIASWRLPLCAACRRSPIATSSRAFSGTVASSSGSNKWSKIKHKKGAKDQAKGNMYSILSREMISAVRNHPSHSISPDQNTRLALLLKKAKDLDVPKEKVEATLQKAAAAGQGANNITYEILGPPTKENVPVALIIECQSDSPPRTMAKVREAVNKNNARLSSTSHLFERTGVIRFLVKNGSSFDDVWETAVENGAQDVRPWEYEDEAAQLGVEIICDPSDVHRLTSLFSSPPLSHEVIESETKLIPSGPLLRIRGEEEDETAAESGETACLQEEDMAKLDHLVAALEEGADCHRVWSNVDGWPA